MWSMKKVKENSRRAKKWNTRGANEDERQQEETQREEKKKTDQWCREKEVGKEQRQEVERDNKTG